MHHTWQVKVIVVAVAAAATMGLAPAAPAAGQLARGLARPRVMVAQQAAPVVYVRVPLGRLCHAPTLTLGRLVRDGTGCAPLLGRVRIGPRLFTYATGFPGTRRSVVMIHARSTTCRSLHLEFGMSNAERRRHPHNLAIVSVSQKHTTGSLLLAPPGETIARDLDLDGGAWTISSGTGRSAAPRGTIWVNGYASCRSRSGH